MNKLILLVILSLAVNAEASDWKLAGHSGGDDQRGEFLFYDNQSLTNTSGIVKFWTKGIANKTLEKIINSKKPSEDVMNEAAKKVASNYSPPIFSTKQFQKNYPTKEQLKSAIVDAVIYETIVNISRPKEKSEMLWELNCNSHQIRTLEINLFDSKGEFSGHTKTSLEWKNIPPDSNGENWHQLFCNN